VPGQEGHPAAAEFADRNGFAGLTEGGIDPDFLGVGQELVETGTPDDTEVRDRCHELQATFSPEELPEEEDELAAEADLLFLSVLSEAGFDPESADEDESAEDELAEVVLDEVVEPDGPLPRLSVR